VKSGNIHTVGVRVWGERGGISLPTHFHTNTHTA
jgi:hypothetical protein